MPSTCQVVCDGCSSKRAVLPGLQPGAVRVCDAAYAMVRVVAWGYRVMTSDDDMLMPHDHYDDAIMAFPDHMIASPHGMAQVCHLETHAAEAAAEGAKHAAAAAHVASVEAAEAGTSGVREHS